LIALDVNNYKEEIVAISVAAEKEHGLKMDLEKLENDWRRLIFPVEFEEKVDSYILKDLERFTLLWMRVLRSSIQSWAPATLNL
jgi:hypothetical protein